MTKLVKSVLVALFLAVSSVQAAPLSVFSGWNLSAPEGIESRSYRGISGHAFDAEYLFYKLEGTKLSTDLQGLDFISNSAYLHSDGYNSANLGNKFGFAAHWTMSCGNDEVEASAFSVPEPGSLLLLGLGLIGLVAVRRRLNR